MKIIRLKGLLLMVEDNQETEEYLETIGIVRLGRKIFRKYIGTAFAYLTFEIPEKNIKVENILWDISPEGTFKLVRKSYFKNASIALIPLINNNDETIRKIVDFILEILLFVGCIPVIIFSPNSIPNLNGITLPENVSLIEELNSNSILTRIVSNHILGIVERKLRFNQDHCIKNTINFVDKISSNIAYNPYLKLSSMDVMEIYTLYKENREDISLKMLHILSKYRLDIFKELVFDDSLDIKEREFYAFILSLWKSPIAEEFYRKHLGFPDPDLVLRAAEILISINKKKYLPIIREYAKNNQYLKLWFLKKISESKDNLKQFNNNFEFE